MDILLVLSEEDDEEQQGEVHHLTYPLAFLDAWSFVDSVFRLWRLLSQMRGIARTTYTRGLFDHLSQYEDLRHGIQHLEGTIIRRDDPEPAHGALSWTYVVSERTHDLATFMLVAGNLGHVSTGSLVNPAGRDFWSRVDHIELEAYGVKAPISETHRRLREFAPIFERPLRDQFVNHETRGSDLLVRVDLSPARPTPNEPTE
jgi:hypothetical protein